MKSKIPKYKAKQSKQQSFNKPSFSINFTASGTSHSSFTSNIESNSFNTLPLQHKHVECNYKYPENSFHGANLCNTNYNALQAESATEQQENHIAAGDTFVRILHKLYYARESLRPVIDEIIKNATTLSVNYHILSVTSKQYSGATKAAQIFEEIKQEMIQNSSTSFKNAKNIIGQKNFVVNNALLSPVLNYELQQAIDLNDRVYIDVGLMSQLIELHELLNDTITKLKDKETEQNSISEELTTTAENSKESENLLSSQNSHASKISSNLSVNEKPTIFSFLSQDIPSVLNKNNMTPDYMLQGDLSTVNKQKLEKLEKDYSDLYQAVQIMNRAVRQTKGSVETLHNLKLSDEDGRKVQATDTVLNETVIDAKGAKHCILTCLSELTEVRKFLQHLNSDESDVSFLEDGIYEKKFVDKNYSLVQDKNDKIPMAVKLNQEALRSTSFNRTPVISNILENNGKLEDKKTKDTSFAIRILHGKERINIRVKNGNIASIISENEGGVLPNVINSSYTKLKTCYSKKKLTNICSSISEEKLMSEVQLYPVATSGQITRQRGSQELTPTLSRSLQCQVYRRHSSNYERKHAPSSKNMPYSGKKQCHGEGHDNTKSECSSTSTLQSYLTAFVCGYNSSVTKIKEKLFSGSQPISKICNINCDLVKSAKEIKANTKHISKVSRSKNSSNSAHCSSTSKGSNNYYTIQKRNSALEKRKPNQSISRPESKEMKTSKAKDVVPPKSRAERNSAEYYKVIAGALISKEQQNLKYNCKLRSQLKPDLKPDLSRDNNSSLKYKHTKVSDKRLANNRSNTNPGTKYKCQDYISLNSIDSHQGYKSKCDSKERTLKCCSAVNNDLLPSNVTIDEANNSKGIRHNEKSKFKKTNESYSTNVSNNECDTRSPKKHKDKEYICSSIHYDCSHIPINVSANSEKKYSILEDNNILSSEHIGLQSNYLKSSKKNTKIQKQHTPEVNCYTYSNDSGCSLTSILSEHCNMASNRHLHTKKQKCKSKDSIKHQALINSECDKCNKHDSQKKLYTSTQMFKTHPSDSGLNMLSSINTENAFACKSRSSADYILKCMPTTKDNLLKLSTVPKNSHKPMLNKDLTACDDEDHMLTDDNRSSANVCKKRKSWLFEFFNQYLKPIAEETSDKESENKSEKDNNSSNSRRKSLKSSEPRQFSETDLKRTHKSMQFQTCNIDIRDSLEQSCGSAKMGHNVTNSAKMHDKVQKQSNSFTSNTCESKENCRNNVNFMKYQQASSSISCSLPAVNRDKRNCLSSKMENVSVEHLKQNYNKKRSVTGGEIITKEKIYHPHNPQIKNDKNVLENLIYNCTNIINTKSPYCKKLCKRENESSTNSMQNNKLLYISPSKTTNYKSKPKYCSAKKLSQHDDHEHQQSKEVWCQNFNLTNNDLTKMNNQCFVIPHHSNDGQSRFESGDKSSVSIIIQNDKSKGSVTIIEINTESNSCDSSAHSILPAEYPLKYELLHIQEQPTLSNRSVPYDISQKSIPSQPVSDYSKSLNKVQGKTASKIDEFKEELDKENVLNTIIKVATPGKCCRKSVLNERPRVSVPYCCSLESLHLDTNDMAHINDTLKGKANSNKHQPMQTSFDGLNYYTSLGMNNHTHPWLIPTYEVRYFELANNIVENKITSNTNLLMQHDENHARLVCCNFPWSPEKFDVRSILRKHSRTQDHDTNALISSSSGKYSEKQRASFLANVGKDSGFNSNVSNSEFYANRSFNVSSADVKRFSDHAPPAKLNKEIFKKEMNRESTIMAEERSLGRKGQHECENSAETTTCSNSCSSVSDTSWLPTTASLGIQCESDHNCFFAPIPIVSKHLVEQHTYSMSIDTQTGIGCTCPPNQNCACYEEYRPSDEEICSEYPGQTCVIIKGCSHNNSKLTVDDLKSSSGGISIIIKDSLDSLTTIKIKDMSHSEEKEDDNAEASNLTMHSESHFKTSNVSMFYREHAKGHRKSNRCCSSLEGQINVDNSRLKSYRKALPNSVIEEELQAIGYDNIIEVATPAKCCRESVLNEKLFMDIPYSVSLRSLRLDGDDINTIKETIKTQNDIHSRNTYNTYFAKLKYYTNLELDTSKVPWVVPDYEVRYFDIVESNGETNLPKNLTPSASLHSLTSPAVKNTEALKSVAASCSRNPGIFEVRVLKFFRKRPKKQFSNVEPLPGISGINQFANNIDTESQNMLKHKVNKQQMSGESISLLLPTTRLLHEQEISDEQNVQGVCELTLPRVTDNSSESYFVCGRLEDQSNDEAFRNFTKYSESLTIATVKLDEPTSDGEKELSSEITESSNNTSAVFEEASLSSKKPHDNNNDKSNVEELNYNEMARNNSDTVYECKCEITPNKNCNCMKKQQQLQQEPIESHDEIKIEGPEGTTVTIQDKNSTTENLSEKSSAASEGEGLTIVIQNYESSDSVKIHESADSVKYSESADSEKNYESFDSLKNHESADSLKNHDSADAVKNQEDDVSEDRESTQKDQEALPAESKNVKDLQSQPQNTVYFHYEKEFNEIGMDKIIKSATPANCCRNSVLNEKPRVCVPYPPSFTSLPLDENDIEHIKNSVKGKSGKNTNECDKTYNTYLTNLEYFTNLEPTRTKIPWTIPNYEVRFFKFLKNIASYANSSGNKFNAITPPSSTATQLQKVTNPADFINNCPWALKAFEVRLFQFMKKRREQQSQHMEISETSRSVNQSSRKNKSNSVSSKSNSFVQNHVALAKSKFYDNTDNEVQIDKSKVSKWSRHQFEMDSDQISNLPEESWAPFQVSDISLPHDDNKPEFENNLSCTNENAGATEQLQNVDEPGQDGQLKLKPSHGSGGKKQKRCSKCQKKIVSSSSSKS